MDLNNINLDLWSGAFKIKNTYIIWRKIELLAGELLPLESFMVFPNNLKLKYTGLELDSEIIKSITKRDYSFDVKAVCSYFGSESYVININRFCDSKKLLRVVSDVVIHTISIFKKEDLYFFPLYINSNCKNHLALSKYQKDIIGETYWVDLNYICAKCGQTLSNAQELI